MNIRTTFRFEDEYISMTRGNTLAFGFETYHMINEHEIEPDDSTLDYAYFSAKTKVEPYDGYAFQKSLGDGILQVEPGVYSVRVLPEDTANLEVGEYWYDLTIGINGDEFTLKKGILNITDKVTKERG